MVREISHCPINIRFEKDLGSEDERLNHNLSKNKISSRASNLAQQVNVES